MESYITMVGWHRYYCNGYNLNAHNECGGMQLFKISSNDTSEKILPKSKEIALRLIYIYFVLTSLCAITYNIFGMNVFDSLTHSMTTIATGGFSNYNES